MCLQMPNQILPHFHRLADLPVGQNCGHCVNFSVCAKIGTVTAKTTRCDFIPSKFQRSYGWRV